MLNSRVSAFTLLQKLIGISEKAAEIARIVRKAYWKNSSNGFIETESKSSEDVTDFKTLADVLIQAVITRELNQAVSTEDYFQVPKIQSEKYAIYFLI